MKRDFLGALFLLLSALLAGCNPPNEESEYYDLEIGIKINLAEKVAEISPLIYGQFLEHIAGCIYDSIWAEKITDRKFYYGIEDAGLSPWTPSEGTNVQTENEDTLSGTDYAMRLLSGGIEQELRTADVDYVGYFYAKGRANVSVKLGEETVATHVDSDDWQKFEFEIRSTTEGKNLFGIYSDAEVLIDSVSLMPSDNYHGMNRATLDALKELKGTVYRWLGGNFVSGYDWKDGIGDRDIRPCRRNLAWFPDRGSIESDINRIKSNGFYACIEPNDMGVDEFLLMCEYIGAIPYLVVNTGLGSVEDAVAMVEYCNGGADTKYGRLRAENGRVEPYNVKYWSVGNEMQGDWQLGHIPLHQYTKRHNEFAEAMKAVDPTILLTACGDNVSPWSEGIFSECSENMDFIGEHLYAETSDDVLEHIALMKNNIEWRITEHRKLLEKFPHADVKIAFDEYAYFWDGYADLKDALGIAMALNIFIRNSDVVGMANYSDAVFNINRNRAPGAINVRDDKAVFQPVGLVLKSYAVNFEKFPVQVFAPYDKNIRMDIAAAVSEDGKTMTIAVVNPSDKIIKLSPNISGWIAKKIEVSGKDGSDFNDFVEEKLISVICDEPKSYLVNPLSVTIFVIKIN